VLVGGSLVGFVVAPAIGAMVGALQRHSRQRGGSMGEAFFLLGLGAVIFWLYYRVYILGPESVLPAGWHNPGLLRK
jgi:bacteriorhodopsin